MPIANTPRHIVQQVILLATGAPGSEAFRSQLLGLYEANGNWNEVKQVVDTYMKGLMADHSIAELVQAMAQNALGLTLSDTETQDVIESLMASGIDTWSELFVFVIADYDGPRAGVLDNRADAANSFTDLLASMNRDSDYDGSQAVAAAREWLHGIDAGDASRLAALDSASSLIARFVDGKVQGTVLDGYVAGATVFVDVNGNGTQDPDEPTTVTDADGNFLFDGELPEGTIVATGGTDLATGKPFAGVLTAPSGATVITPLTTLVQQMLVEDPTKSVADAEAVIFDAFGIPKVDLSSFDPIQKGLDTGATRDEQVVAAKIQAATSQLVNVLNVGTALLNNLDPGKTNAGTAALSALVTTLTTAAAGGQTVNLADPTTVANVLKQSATVAGIIDTTSTPEKIAQVDLLSTQAGASLQEINDRTQQAATNFAADESVSFVTAMSDVFSLQTVTTDLSTAIKDNTSGNLGDLTEQFSGNKLTESLSDVTGGLLNPETPTNGGTNTGGNGNGNGGSNEPEPDFTPALSLASDTGTSAADRITSNGTVNVGNLSSTWEYSVDGGSSWTTGSGSSFTLTGDGLKTVRVRQADDPSHIATFSFTLDTSAPSAPSAALTADTGNASDGITSNGAISIGALESGASWQYSVDGGSTWTTGTGTSFNVSGNGAKQVLVRQTDRAGNVSSAASLSFTLDSSAPSAPSLAISDTGASGISQTFSDKVTASGVVNVGNLESGASWAYSTDGGSTWTTGGSSNSFTLSGDGVKAVLVRQSDVAGNTSSNAALSFTLDTSAPATPSVALNSDTGLSAISDSFSDGVTSDAVLVVDGLEAGATWQYSIDGGSNWTTGGSDNNFTVSGDGVKSVLVRQIDGAGNVSSYASMSFTLDTTAPNAPSVALANDTGVSGVSATLSDTATSSGIVAVSGLESGAAWQYSTDGGCTWTAGGSSNSFTLSGEGAKSVLVRQSDVAGNMSSAASLSFTLDTSAPDAPVLALGSDTGISGVSGTLEDGITQDSTISVTGLESTGAWEYQVNSSDSTWTSGSGDSVDLGLGDGDYIVYVRQYDAAGNVSANASIEFTVDTSAPDAPALALTSDTGISGFTHTFSDNVTANGTVTVSGLESAAAWQYSTDAGSTWTTGGSSNSFTLSGDGAKSVLVRQIDAAGNVSSNAALSFTVDTTAPDAPTPALDNDTGMSGVGNSLSDYITSDALINIGGLESTAIWEWQVDGSEGAWTLESSHLFTPDNLADGDHTVYVRQYDNAGNVSSIASLSFTLDTSAPGAPSVALASNTGVSGISYTFSDNFTNNGQLLVSGVEPGAAWQYSTDGGSSWTTGGSDNSFTLTGDDFYSVRVRQIDGAGNISSEGTISFTLDTTAPAAASLALASDTGVSGASSTFNDGVTTDTGILVNNIETNSIWAYQVDNNTSTWTIGSGSSFDAGALADGEHTVYVRKYDLAGNVAEDASFTFTVDTSAPATPELALANDTGVSGLGNSLSDNITTDDTLSIGGLESAIIWEYQINDSNSDWTSGSGDSLDLGLGDGDYVVYVRQYDGAGNVSSLAALSFTLDTEAPPAPSVSIVDTTVNDFTLWASDGLTSNGTVTVSGLESGAAWQYSTDAGCTWTSGGTENSFTLSGDDEHAVLVRQIDGAGNISSYTPISFTLDTIAPSAPLLTLHDTGMSGIGDSLSDGITSAVSISLGGLEATPFWEYQVDSSSGVWFLVSGNSFTDTLDDGEHTLYVRQYDLAGNVSSISSLTFMVDTSAPGAPTLALANNTGISGASFTFSDSITSDGLLVVSDLEDGAGWQYSTDGGSNWTTGGSENNFTVSGDGVKDVLVRQIDGAGNVSSYASMSFTLDTTAPSLVSLALANDTGVSGVSSTSNDNITTDTGIVVSGLDSTAALWDYQVDSSAGTWTRTSGGSFDAGSLADGQHTVYVRQYDLAGNVSGNASFTFTVDTSAPATPELALANDTGISGFGNSLSDNITTDDTLNIGGLESAIIWEYQINDSNSDWTSGSGDSLDLGLGDGDHVVYVRQYDGAGNVSSLAAISFTLDTEAPPAPSLLLGEDTGHSDFSDTFSDKVTSTTGIAVDGLESGAVWEYQVNSSSGSWTIGSGSTFDAGELADGTHTVYVRQTDGAGNISNTSALSFTLDTAMPSTPFATISDTGVSGFAATFNDSVTTNGVVTVSGVEPGANWQYSMDAGETWSTGGSGNSFTLIGNGTKAVLVRQIDGAGHVSSNAALSFTLDTSAPLAPSLALNSDTGFSEVSSTFNDGITSDSLIQVSSLDSSGAVWEYQVDSSTSDWSPGNGSNIFSVEGDGTHTVYVRQYDGSGNVSSAASLTFTLDTSAPLAPSVAPANDTGISGVGNTLSDNITTDGTISVDSELGAIWQYSLDAASTWNTGSGSSFSVSGEGDHSVLVRQIDSAGNVSSTTAFSFTIDTSAPSAPVLSISDTGHSGISGSFSDSLTNVNAVTVSGLESGANWQYKLDVSASTWLNGSGNQFTLPGDGHYAVLVRQVDGAGNVSNGTSLSFDLDTGLPEVPTFYLSTDSGDPCDHITNNGDISVLSIEDGAVWEYKVDEGEWTLGSGSSFSVSGDGDHDVWVRQIDIAGNASPVASDTGHLAFTLDTSAPSAVSISLARDTGHSASDGLTTDGTILVTGLEDGATIEYITGCSWSAIGLAEGGFTLTGNGDYTVMVRQVDTAGNTSSASDPLSFTLFDGVIELSNLYGRGFALPGVDGQLGRSVSAAGDVNGDGYEDFIVSAPRFDGHGTAYVVFGSSSRYSGDFDLSDLGLNGSNAFRLDGVDSYSSGNSVSAAGDINGDGFGDLIVGATGGDRGYHGSPDYASDAGRTYVIFGGSSGFSSPLDVENLYGTNGFRLTGENAYDHSGWSVSGAGDIDGDGYDDLIIGAPGTDANGYDSSGTVYVVFGTAAGFAPEIDLGALDGSDGFRIDGLDNYYALGAAVSAAGDVNGDGYRDIIVGAYKAGEYAGAAFVVFGTDQGFSSSLDLGTLDGSNGFRLSGAGQEYAGFAVSGVGDLDGDGYDDLAVASNGAGAYIVFGKPTDFAGELALANLGSDGFPIAGIDPSTASDLSVSGAGDINGDGYDDLIVGLPHTSGDSQVYVVFGRSDLASIDLSHIDGDNGFRLIGIDPSDHAGWSVSGAGDIDGDGYDDLLVGAPHTGFDYGAAFVIFGGDFRKTTTFAGNSGFNYFEGSSAAEVFVGGDGLDLLVGGGGADVFNGGNGNDLIGVSDLGFFEIDGGRGYDTLALDGDLNLTLADFRSKIRNIEMIDMGGMNVDGPATLTLTAQDVLNLSNSTNSLAVYGSATDTLNVAGEWAYDGVDGDGYEVYFLDGATLRLAIPNANITLDTSPPAAPFIYLAEDTGYGSDNVTANGTVNVGGLEPYASWEYSVDDGSTWTSGSGSSFVLEADGYYEVRVRQHDRAGNDSEESSQLALRVDTTVSQPSLSYSDTGSNTSDSITSDNVIAVSNLESGATWEYSRDGGCSWHAGEGTSFLAHSGSEYMQYLHVRQTDLAGNVSSAAYVSLLVDTSAMPPELESLDGSDGFLLTATSSNPGTRVANAGDVNGDGYDDVILLGLASGEVRVVFGNSGSFDSGDSASDFPGFQIDASTSDLSLSAAGDVNGDGYDDVIIGDKSTATSYVVFGRASATAVDLSDLDSADGFILQGSVGSLAGWSVSGAGDVNGDGFDDVIIGAGDAGDGGWYAGGSAYVVFGKDTGFTTVTLADLDGADGFRVTGGAMDMKAGIAVGGAGDVNGDGYDDLIVDAKSDSQGPGDGFTYVVFGGGDDLSSALVSGALALSRIDLGESSLGFRVNRGAGLRADVGSAGDINGDGLGDLYIRSPEDGEISVIFGASSFSDFNPELGGVNGFRLTGFGSGAVSVSAGGDINGDGYDELLIGTPDAPTAGFTYVIFGGSSFNATLAEGDIPGIDTFTLEDAGVRLAVSQADVGLGFSVGGGGDVNGDGFADLITGTSAGSAFVVFGNDWSAAVSLLGSDSNDVIAGEYWTSEVFIGGEGDDVLIGAGAGDVFHAGRGDDTIKVSSLGFRVVDGGSGRDTLVFNASIDFSLADLRGKVRNIEAIDISGADHVLRVEEHDVATLFSPDLANDEGSNVLTVIGDSSSVLWLEGSWEQVETALSIYDGTYDKYVSDNHEVVLLVGSDITIGTPP